MQKPPLTFEEFLQSQGLKSWPRCISLDEPHSLVDKLQKDCSFNALSKSLYEHVPLNVSSLSDLENRIKSCITDLKKHAEKISSLQCGPAYLEEQLIDLEQKITSEQTDAEKLLTQTSEMQKVKFAKHIVEESKGTNVENCNYPGFKIKQLLELPRHLEAPKLWNLVIKAQHFQKDILKVWRSLFLSKSSISVFQDSFWWWFLQKFKPNQEDQDHFFGRIAENFVVLFLLVPIEAKDTFFQVYPDCLSQVIYVTFCEAFPESIKNFDDDFKDGLVDLIFQWISGLKPRKCVWEKWNLESFKASTVNPNREGATANIRARGSARSAAASEDIICKDLLEDRKYMADEEISEDSEHTNDMPKESETITESCIGSDPECKRVLLRFGAQCPLVSYYLKKHKIDNTVPYSLTCRTDCTEVYKLPTAVALTYQDVTKEPHGLGGISEGLH